MTEGKSFKSQNMKWLVLLAVADVLAIVLFVAPELSRGVTISELGAGRLLTTTVMPVVVLLLVNVLPSELKSLLVFWKVRNALPGCRAFTEYAPRDSRIDLAALKENVGGFPIKPAEQNAKWYKLYRLVLAEANVRDAHQHFLMYRDMAALSFPLIIIMPLALNVMGVSHSAVWLALALFLVQYLLTAVSARWSGIRFVCNVLAVHSVKKVA